MSRLPADDALVDRPDPIVLAADARHERPRRDDVEPWDFDDARLADRYGVTGSHFPGLDRPNDDDWMD